jgi:hypothetical protein
MHTEAEQRMLGSLQQWLSAVRPVAGQNICMGQCVGLVCGLCSGDASLPRQHAVEGGWVS